MAATVPAGPLAVRWHGVDVAPVRAGAPFWLTVELENAGSAEWRTRGPEGIHLSYHWLDDRGNAIVWDGERTALPEPVAPGRRLRLPLHGRAPMPPGRYRLAVDLLDEFRLWFAELGNVRLEREVDVAPRVGRRLAALGGDPAALSGQDEPLVTEEPDAVAHLPPHAAPAPDWSTRVLDAHQEGFGIVGAAIVAPRGLLGRRDRRFHPWASGGGRVPGFAHPFVCPSVVRGVEPDWVDAAAGLPAVRPTAGEPALFDGRILVRLR